MRAYSTTYAPTMAAAPSVTARMLANMPAEQY